jgi:hypothetical protein
MFLPSASFSQRVRKASYDTFSELLNFALGDFLENVELIPTQQLFFQMH